MQVQVLTSNMLDTQRFVSMCVYDFYRNLPERQGPTRIMLQSLRGYDIQQYNMHGTIKKR